MGNDGTVTIMGPDDRSVQEAVRVIQLMIQEVEVGQIYRSASPLPLISLIPTPFSTPKRVHLMYRIL